ncbi:MAG: hypothetical protein PHF37_03130 [Phycisphaerae bacterium]|jgi:hypothetical protein|nr:hypothetical protein [Phycisphaerae bacterium]
MAEHENQIQHVEAMAVEKDALEIMERASIDIQISTAHKYPRSLAAFNQRAKEMVSVDIETAESCIYRRPVGKDASGRQTFASGESVRLAEIVAACYGNLRVGAIITEMTPTYVKACGMAHDLESNFAQKTEVVESTVTRSGKPYDERMRIVVAKAAQAKAKRDAIFGVVPKSLCKSITAVARGVIEGNQKPLTERRAAVESWMSKLSISKERVFVALGVKGIEEVGNEEIETLTGLRTALRDGDITLEEAFPPIAEEQTPGVEGLKKRLQIDKKNTATKPGSANPADTDTPPTAQLDPELAELDRFTQPPPQKTPQDASGAMNIDPSEQFYCQHCGNVFPEPKSATIKGAKKSMCPECLSEEIIDRTA